MFDTIQHSPARRRVTAALLCAALALPVALAVPPPPAQAQTVVTYALPSGLPAGDNGSGICTVSAAGQSSGVYKYVGTATTFGYTTFESDSRVQVQVTFPSGVTSAVVRPKSYGITPQIGGNTVSFSMYPGRRRLGSWALLMMPMSMSIDART